jgi:hypothetical protein
MKYLLIILLIGCSKVQECCEIRYDDIDWYELAIKEGEIIENI